MRAWLTYARLLLPWWVFRRTRPSATARLDWGYVRWGRVPSGPQRRSEPFGEPLQHMCPKGRCRCLVRVGSALMPAAPP